jgi:hypothetical protein
MTDHLQPESKTVNFLCRSAAVPAISAAGTEDWRFLTPEIGGQQVPIFLKMGGNPPPYRIDEKVGWFQSF